jgi:hypothetical protein
MPARRPLSLATLGHCATDGPRESRQIRTSVPPLLRQNRHVADEDQQMVSLTFSKSDWRLIQEALDNEYYE